MPVSDFSRPRTIRPHTPLRLADAIGQRITVLTGAVWITQQDDSRDIILKPGDSFTVERPACLVVAGDGDAEVLLRQTDPAGSRAPSSRPAWLRWVTTSRASRLGRLHLPGTNGA